MRKLLLVTDSADQAPVAEVLNALVQGLRDSDITTTVVDPGLFSCVTLPGGHLQMPLNPWQMHHLIHQTRPDAVHIAGNGVLAALATIALTRGNLPFTRFAQPVVPAGLIRSRLASGYQRWLQQPAVRLLCTTTEHARLTADAGLTQVCVWGAGVDTDVFTPQPRVAAAEQPRLLYIDDPESVPGAVTDSTASALRHANLQAFLELEMPADKTVLSPDVRAVALRVEHPDVHWLSLDDGDTLLTTVLSAADALVYTATDAPLAAAVLQANACGTPVAARPGARANDLITTGINGCVHEDLGLAVSSALEVDRDACRRAAVAHDWLAAARQFADLLTPIDWAGARRVTSQRARPRYVDSTG